MAGTGKAPANDGENDNVQPSQGPPMTVEAIQNIMTATRQRLQSQPSEYHKSYISENPTTIKPLKLTNPSSPYRE